MLASVMRQSRASMAITTVTSVTTFDTTVPSVPVTARWAPMTSLFKPADQCTRLGPREELHRHALHVVEQADPEVVDEAFTDAGRPAPLEQRDDRRRNRGSHHEQRLRDQQGGVLVGKGGVDDRLEHERGDEREERLEDDRHQEPRELPSIGSGEGHDAAHEIPIETLSADLLRVLMDHAERRHAHGGEGTAAPSPAPMRGSRGSRPQESAEGPRANSSVNQPDGVMSAASVAMTMQPPGPTRAIT